MADIDKVKIVVVGDSGVGKTSLTHLIAHNEVMASPAWTVGCSVEVKLHEFREGYPQQRTFFVELWDVGGSCSHRNTRSIFYTPVHGVLLVHDLTNRKSQVNLYKWLAEILNHECGNKRSIDELDAEMMLGASNLPLLVIGTKADQAPPRGGAARGLTFAEEVGCEEVTLDCRQTRCLAAGSSAAVKLSRFFDRAVEKKLSVKGDGMSPASAPARRKVASQCSHAAVSCYKQTMTSQPGLVTSWEAQGQPKVVVRAPAAGESALTAMAQAAAKHNITAVIIRDAGRTQISSGTATVLGLGPASSDVIDNLTKSLRLY